MKRTQHLFHAAQEMSNETERKGSPSTKRKLNVWQSHSTPISAASAVPITTTHQFSPPLPPMSSHPALARKQVMNESLQAIHHPHSNEKSNTLPRPLMSSWHKARKCDNGTSSLTSSLKVPLLPPKPPAPFPYVPFVPILDKSATSGLATENERSHSDLKIMSLSELNRSPQCKLPMQVMVTTGFQGPSRKSTIPDGEHLNLLCLKKRKLVVIETLTGMKIKVPLNSSLQFGILYNPTNNLKQAVKGFHYKTAGNILSLSVLPKLICATKQHKATRQENAVHKREVLLLYEATTNSQSKRALPCIQMDSGKHKNLLEDCAGLFTTQPASVKMFLPEIINHIDLPQMAVVFFPEKLPKVDFNNEKGFLLAPQEVVRITGVISENSFLATLSSPSRIAAIQDQNGRSPSHMVLDIPMDHPVLKVRVIQSSPSEQENIAKLAKELVQGPSTKHQHPVRIENDAAMFDAILLKENSDPQQELFSSESSPSPTREQFSLELDSEMSAPSHSSIPLQAYAYYDPETFTTLEVEDEVEEETNGQQRPDLQQCKSEETSLLALIEAVRKELKESNDGKQKQIEILREEMANLRSIVQDLHSQCKEMKNQQGTCVNMNSP